jgi:hypothetical protein
MKNRWHRVVLVIIATGILGYAGVKWGIKQLNSVGIKWTPEMICDRQLRHIWIAISKYQTENKMNTMPKDLVEVVSKGFLAPELLICPASGKSFPAGLNKQEKSRWAIDNSDYIYIGAGIKSDSKNLWHIIVAYEKENHAKGAGPFVLYGDGHTSHESPITLERAMAQSKKLREQEE